MSPQVLIVDDDPLILKRAWNILTEAGMKAAILKSGLMIKDYIRDNGAPDLILLDISMPDMDGFDVLTELRKTEEKGKEIPIIFLTANEDEAAETRGLSLGAMDYIRKPFIADILVLRVSHAIELVRLQRELGREVDRKTKEIEELYLNLVSSLADAIDAKDAYTNGHSRRVAQYSREIARRMGKSQYDQNEIYNVALLHDIGKIAIPNGIIAKPGKLTDEEFRIIKSHTVRGYEILKNITVMPLLYIGARWHHERYDGRGYPDGRKGTDIPEIARIISVADCYDAMSSDRSYRKALPQSKVRSEIENGLGTQFDPEIGRIMIAMIDDDRDYRMCHSVCFPHQES